MTASLQGTKKEHNHIYSQPNNEQESNMMRKGRVGHISDDHL